MIKDVLKNRIARFILMVFFGVDLILFCGMNDNLRVTHWDYDNSVIPEEFDDYRIAQITDLHCKKFGKNQEKLIFAVKDEKPDLIVITGDTFDQYHWDYSAIKNLLAGISTVAPIYAVTGNNEYDNADMFSLLMELYNKYGVTVLNDEKAVIKKGNDTINLYGMYYRYYIKEKYNTLYGQDGMFNLLLYHDPKQFEKLKQHGFNLILTGHTHGGIIRLPVAGGLIDNDHGFFPKFDYGKFVYENTTMYVSTGLGDTSIPRFFNRPELAVITLHKDYQTGEK